MYASCVGKRFRLEHCWVILRKKPKWQSERASQHQRQTRNKKVMSMQIQLHQFYLLMILLVYEKTVNR
jgi:hypothetical protein